MKWIVAVLCAVSLNAIADTWTMPNNGGGQIVLTDRKCKGYSKLLEAYSYTGKGYWEGCWTLIDGKVHIAWEGNERRVYDISDFKPDEITPKKKGSAL